MAGISKRKRGIKAEVYFLKYAFPCAFIGMQRGRFDAAAFCRLEKAAVKNEVISFKVLAKYFPAAIRRISAIAKKRGCKKWNVALIREYFLKEHNRLISAKKEDYKYAPASLCELCKVLEGKVVSLKPESFAVVRLKGGKKRSVLTKLAGRLKIGDRVMVHYGYAVERIVQHI